MFVRVSQWGEISVWSCILIFMSLRFDKIFKKHSFLSKNSQKLYILWIRRCMIFLNANLEYVSQNFELDSLWIRRRVISFECEFRNYFTKLWVSTIEVLSGDELYRDSEVTFLGHMKIKKWVGNIKKLHVFLQ